MKHSILKSICEESGADSSTVRSVATLLLRELHFVAATDRGVTTGALMETFFELGTEAAYHLGGLLMYHDDKTNEPGFVSDSLMEETMTRLLGTEGEVPEIKERWLNYLAENKPSRK